MDPKQLRYTETHEWVNLEGETCTIGLSQFAVDQLTDVVHLELPKVGATIEQGKSFGEIESVKAVSDIYGPIAGEVVEINALLVEDAANVSDDPLGAGWLIKVKVAPGTTLDHLKTWEDYQQQIESEA